MEEFLPLVTWIEIHAATAGLSNFGGLEKVIFIVDSDDDSDGEIVNNIES